eukprot:scaffold160065_cov27-Tisochrysis_lutea.AAC.1
MPADSTRIPSSVMPSPRRLFPRKSDSRVPHATRAFERAAHACGPVPSKPNPLSSSRSKESLAPRRPPRTPGSDSPASAAVIAARPSFEMRQPSRCIAVRAHACNDSSSPMALAPGSPTNTYDKPSDCSVQLLTECRIRCKRLAQCTSIVEAQIVVGDIEPAKCTARLGKPGPQGTRGPLRSA